MRSEKEEHDTHGQVKVGVYICHCGGNISDHVDVEKLEELAAGLPGVALARRNTFMCSDPGQQMIMEDLREGRINRVVVASCAPSLHETTFRSAIARAGKNPYLYEHANIREQVSWVHHGPGATIKAAALVAAAVAKASNLEPLQPLRVDAWRHATVIGGGVAGLKAAEELSRRGIKVALVEKTPFLGGNTARLDLVFPTGEKAGDLIESLSERILNNPDVQLLTCAEVVSFEGYVGNFRLKVKRRPPDGMGDGEKPARVRETGLGRFIPLVGIQPLDLPDKEEEVFIETGSVVLATGFRHYTPGKGEYGYGVLPQVITLPDLIRRMSEDREAGRTLEMDGKAVRAVAMIHCVGSRQIPGLNEPLEGGRLNEHCSRVCCTAALQAAVELRTRYPDTAVYDLYRDIRTYGRGHEEYYLEASRKAVCFLRFTAEQPPVVSASQDEAGALRIHVADTMLGMGVEIPVDLVVLAVGMEPGETASIAEMMKLPTGADGFLLEVHPKLRPVEVASGGILLAGTAQAPMDITEATTAASAAAVKASAILSRGHVELDPFVARVQPELCTGCGECIGACLREGAMVMEKTENGSERASVNPALCRGCGVCVAACPRDAIDVCGWTLKQYEAMVDAIVGIQEIERGEG